MGPCFSSLRRTKTSCTNVKEDSNFGIIEPLGVGTMVQNNMLAVSSSKELKYEVNIKTQEVNKQRNHSLSSRKGLPSESSRRAPFLQNTVVKTHEFLLHEHRATKKHNQESIGFWRADSNLKIKVDDKNIAISRFKDSFNSEHGVLSYKGFGHAILASRAISPPVRKSPIYKFPRGRDKQQHDQKKTVKKHEIWKGGWSSRVHTIARPIQLQARTPHSFWISNNIRIPIEKDEAEAEAESDSDDSSEEESDEGSNISDLGVSRLSNLREHKQSIESFRSNALSLRNSSLITSKRAEWIQEPSEKRKFEILLNTRLSQIHKLSLAENQNLSINGREIKKSMSPVFGHTSKTAEKKRFPKS